MIATALLNTLEPGGVMSNERRNVLFTQPLECGICNTEKMFFGEDTNGDKKQAKINAYVSAAESGWYIDYMPECNMCDKCRNLPENQNFLE